MNYFLKNKNLVPHIIFYIVSFNLVIMLIMMLLGIFGVNVVHEGKSFSINLFPAPINIIPMISTFAVIGLAIFELAMSIIYKDYRKVRLSNSKSLGVDEVLDERSDFVLGQAAKRAMAFNKMLLLPSILLIVITSPYAFNAASGKIFYSKGTFKFVLIADKLITTDSLISFLFITSPIWILLTASVGAQLIFRKALRDLKFDFSN